MDLIIFFINFCRYESLNVNVMGTCLPEVKEIFFHIRSREYFFLSRETRDTLFIVLYDQSYNLTLKYN